VSVFPRVADNELAVERDTEAVRDARFTRAVDDDLTDFFFKTFSHAQLDLVVDPEHKHEIS
jgi:hypothetical protein